MKKCAPFFIFLILFSIRSFAYSVDISDETDPHFYYSNAAFDSNSISLVRELSSDYGKTKDSPNLIYVPIKNLTNVNYSLVGSPSLIGDLTSGSQGRIKFSLDVTNDSDQIRYLKVAFESASGVWRTVTPYSYDSGNSSIGISETRNDYGVVVDLFNLCSLAGSGTTQYNCDVTAGSGIKLFFFLATTDLASNDTSVNMTSEESKGYFVKLFMSNTAPTTVTPILNSLTTGDSRLYANFSSALLSTNFYYKTMVIKYNAALGSATDYQSTSGSAPTIYSSESNMNGGGEITIKNLDNNFDYNFSVVQVDKFWFGSLVSKSLTGRPLSIQTLLDKKSCYLLTAGFGREHYVVEYFRSIRDQYLMSFGVGRSFVDWYYHSAPQYTDFILKHTFVQKVIQSAAFMAYFFFKHPIYLVLIFFILIFTLLRRKSGNIKLDHLKF